MSLKYLTKIHYKYIIRILIFVSNLPSLSEQQMHNKYISWPPYWPDALDHEPLLLWAHLDNEQRTDLSQTLEQVHGVLNRHGTDGVGFWQRSDQLTEAVVLPVEQTEHQTHQLWVLNERLLGPVDHGVGDQLLKGALVKWTQRGTVCKLCNIIWYFYGL